MTKIKSFFVDEIAGKVLLLSLSGVSIFLSLIDIVTLPLNIAWVSIILCGVPIVYGAVKGLITSFDIKADVLVSMALIASLFIGETFAAGEVAFIMQLGALLEEITAEKAKSGIEKLIRLTPETARLIIKGHDQIIAASQVQKGDMLRVLAGESIPVDGMITKGKTSVDQSIMTGESMPVDKSEGDEVMGGTFNQFGTFDMCATKVGEDSTISRMVRLVQSASADNARIVSLTDQWATWIVVIALSASILTGLITGEIIRAVTILIVFCPCALVLATPTAIVAAIGNATKHGILVRNGDALERLSKVKLVAFDKTGTLTYGKPVVRTVCSFDNDLTDRALFRLLASAELKSEHPIGNAVVRSFGQHESINEPDSFEMIPGRGVRASVNGEDLLAGNLELLSENNSSMSETIRTESMKYLNDGCSIIYISLNHSCVGFAALSDAVRENASEMVNEIRSLGVNPFLLTGDSERPAASIAKSVGISEYRASLMPEDKLEFISSSQAKKEWMCMIGDGVNDAPALKKAYVGIAMGAVGSDIAVEAADIALVRDDIGELPHLLSLSALMMKKIKSNIIFSMTLNVAATILAMIGILNPIYAALVHNIGSVFVTLNAALLLRWKQKKTENQVAVPAVTS